MMGQTWPFEGDYKFHVTKAKYYGCGWYDDAGNLVEEVRESDTEVVVARSVNRVVEFDRRLTATTERT